MTLPSDASSLQFARSQIRIMRTMIAANNRMISSYEDHNLQLQMMIDNLERELTRGDIHEIIRLSPGLAPPPLRRQTNATPMVSIYPRIHDLINNESGHQPN